MSPSVGKLRRTSALEHLEEYEMFWTERSLLLLLQLRQYVSLLWNMNGKAKGVFLFKKKNLCVDAVGLSYIEDLRGTWWDLLCSCKGR